MWVSLVKICWGMTKSHSTIAKQPITAQFRWSINIFYEIWKCQCPPLPSPLTGVRRYTVTCHKEFCAHGLVTTWVSRSRNKALRMILLTYTQNITHSHISNSLETHSKRKLKTKAEYKCCWCVCKELNLRTFCFQKTLWLDNRLPSAVLLLEQSHSKELTKLKICSVALTVEWNANILVCLLSWWSSIDLIHDTRHFFNAH